MKNNLYSSKLILILLFTLLLVALNLTASKLSAQNSDILGEYTGLKEIEQTTHQLELSYDSIKLKIPKINEVLPLQENMFTLISWIEEQAKNNSLDLITDFDKANTSIPVKDEKSKNDSQPSLNATLELAGTLPNILLFLKDIEDGPYIIKIEKLDTIANGDLNNISAKAIIKIYVDKKYFN